MVRPREDSAQTPSNSEGRLERSSEKVAAIRRGQLKISGPYPAILDEPQGTISKRHTDPMPSSRSGGQHSSRSLLQTASLNGQEIFNRTEMPPAEPESPRLRHKRSSDRIRDISEKQRTESPTEPSPYRNLPSALTAPVESHQMAEPKKKRKVGGFRGALRRMFSKRPKQAPAPQSSHGYSNSAPPNLSSQLPKKDEDLLRMGPQKPTIQYNPQGITPATPLGSHIPTLPFPMNVNAPQAASPPHNYLTFDAPPQIHSHRRRATLPSMVFSSTEVAALSAIWGATGAQVTTADEEIAARNSLPSPGKDGEIGVALTSPKKVKRRSRSAGALYDVRREQEERGVERRRSQEIRYWRRSTMVGGDSSSLYSEHKETPLQESREMLPVAEGSENEGLRIGEDESEIYETPVTQPKPSIEEQRIQEFNFGPLGPLEEHLIHPDQIPDIDTESEADKENEAPELPLEDRVFNLENSLRSVQQGIQRLQGRNNRHTIILENAPTGRRSRDHSSSSQREPSGLEDSGFQSYASYHQLAPQASSREESSHSPSTFLASPSTTTTVQPAYNSFLTTSHPSSTHSQHEVRPSASAPALFSPNTTSTTIQELVAHLTTLTDLLHHERNARKNLEGQLHELRDEFNTYCSSAAGIRPRTAHASHGASPLNLQTGYPTPSPDQIFGPSLHTPSQSDPPNRPETARRAVPQDTERFPSFVNSDFGMQRDSYGQHSLTSIDRRHMSRFSWEDSEGKPSLDIPSTQNSTRNSAQSTTNTGAGKEREMELEALNASTEKLRGEIGGEYESVASESREDHLISPGSVADVFETPTEESRGYRFEHPPVEEGGMF